MKSADVELADGVPFRANVPRVGSQAEPGSIDGQHRVVGAVYADVPANQSAQHVRGVGFVPTQQHGSQPNAILERLERNRATYRPPAGERTGEDAAGGVKQPGEVAPSPELAEAPSPVSPVAVIGDCYARAAAEGWTWQQAAAVVVSRLGLDGAA